MAKKDDAQTVSIGGHRLRVTSLDKVIYPETGTTKADVLNYYVSIADVILPHVRDRPATRKRWVDGVGSAEEPGDVFFQKNLDDSTPKWVKRRPIEHSDHTNDYPLVNDVATLAWFAQISALEIHVPQWRFGRNGARRNPDRLVLDLDPGAGVGLPECVQVAQWARAILKDVGLETVPVTSGSKGIHLYAPLDGSLTSDQASAFAKELARALEAEHPDLVVSKMKKSLRDGKVFVDWSQNNGSKTTVAPYSLRGRLRPTVAVPRTWRELASKDLGHLEYDEVLKRMKRRKDPLLALVASSDADLEPTAQRLAGFEASGSGTDRLARYRSKRDASKTPEPVPDDAPAPTDGFSFVIQEHHARRLHYDFRLEHDGVLVSWALPKGVPTDPAKNRLAVQTEDHPLEYGSFEGTIPRGEYGAGEVTIWDSGTYELEKWRDGEVIVSLHGQPGGRLGAPTRVALIRTGGEGKDDNWLMHLMKDSPSLAGEAPDEKAQDARGSRSGQGGSPARSARTRGRALRPMLASPGELDDVLGDEWAYEMKWDGIRALAVLGPKKVSLISRNGHDVTVSYPELVDPLRRAVGEAEAVIDGEIVALGSEGVPSFSRLQQRMGVTKKADAERLARSVPVQFLVFDILEHDGSSLVRLTYAERRNELERLVTPTGPVQVPPAFEGDAEEALEASRQLRLEGILAKRLDSRYRPGLRSMNWVKVKHSFAQEVVVGGWRPGSGRRAGGVGSLLLGVPSGDGLEYVGRVGTGFSDAELAAIHRRLSGLSRKTSPFADVPRADASDANWVTPSLVGEVEFAEWTDTGRLRQPSWRGWRPDKSPADVRRET